MSLRLGLLVAAVVAVVLGGIGFTVNKLVLPSDVTLSKPWIEIVAPGVFELAGDQKTEKRELQTGDELENGTVVGVRKEALANIYFPDGSVARLDSETRLVVEAGEFNPKNNNLNVQLNLLWGRVWSKVITVLTPESTWEVKTTNAVAVVRGTAFGVEYVEEGKSNIVGYENKVAVKLIDPETKKVLPVIAMVVEAKKVLEVKKEVIENIKAQLAVGELRQGAAVIATKAGKPLIEVKEASEKVLNQDWVKRGIEADKKLDEKLRGAREKIKVQKEATKESQKEIQEESRGQIEEHREVIKTTTEESKTSEVQTLTSVAPTTVVEKVGQVKSLAIKASRDLTIGLVEGDSVPFRALAQYEDGSEKEVTSEASWKVLGKIGFIKLPGVFVAKLDPEVSELGVSSGAVVAVWKNSETGTAFEAASPIFKVELEIDLNFDPSRG